MYISTMKVALILVCFAFAFALVNPVQVQDEESTVFEYITKYGIPQAEKIRKAEEEYLRTGSRIVGGAPAIIGQYPYQAGLISDIVGITGRGVCGGSLLTTSRLVTAAHCWNDGRNQAWRFEVVLGSVLLFSGGTRIHTSAVVVHSQWIPTLARNDVAMIYLPNPVTVSVRIATIALPSGEELNLDFVGSSAFASGFGITQDNQDITSSQSLNHVRLNIISNSVCSIGYPLLIQPSHICTSSIRGVSTCGGDSGGPLAVDRAGRNILVGITSFGHTSGCESGMPAVFSRVTSFISFINQHI